MGSRDEMLIGIQKEVEEALKDSQSDKLYETVNKILMRLAEARKFLDLHEDATGRHLSSKTVGHYIYKTFRMTQEPNFNRILVKYLPGKFRKLTQTFLKLDEVSKDVLAYDYKKIKAAESDVRKIHAFLVKSQNACMTAAQREENMEKSDFLHSLSNDIAELISMIYLGKNLDNSVCNREECNQKVSAFWDRIEDLKWNEYISDELRNPVFALDEMNKNFDKVFEHYITKKFRAKKEGPHGTDSKPSKTMQEDVVHIEFDKSQRKPLKKRSKAAPSSGRKKGISTGPTLSRKGRSRSKMAPIHRPGIDEKSPGFTPIKRKLEDGTVLEDPKVKVAPVAVAQKASAPTPPPPIHKPAQPPGSPVADMAPVNKPVTPLSEKMPAAPGISGMAKPPMAPKPPAAPELKRPPLTPPEPPKPVEKAPLKAPEVQVTEEKPKPEIKAPVRPPIHKAAPAAPAAPKAPAPPAAPTPAPERPKAAAPLPERDGAFPHKAGGVPDKSVMFRKVEKSESPPVQPPKPPAPPKPAGLKRPPMPPVKPKPVGGGTFLSQKAPPKPRSFLSGMKEEAPETKKITDDPIPTFAPPTSTEMLPPLENFYGDVKKKQEEMAAGKAEDPQTETTEPQIAFDEEKPKKKFGCLPAFIGIGMSVLAMIITLISSLGR